MDVPVEVERLMKIYNSMSKEEFTKFVKSNEQAQADMEVTIEWLKKELEPFAEMIRRVAESLAETIQPILNDFLSNKEALMSISRIQNTMSLGA